MNFIQHAEAHGLVLRDLHPDGRWHRVPTTDHPNKRNGAYVFDGQFGAVQNWATMQEVALFRPDGVDRVSRLQYKKMAKATIEEDRQRHEKARQEANAIIRECQRGEHPYLVSKGFPAAQGLIHPSGDLIIPMRDFKHYGTVNGIQRISQGGAKKFLFGTKAKGSVFVIGKGALRERWLVEGYATGLSVQAALLDLRRQAEVVVCFSAGNLKHIAEMVKRPAFVIADNDESGTGEAAAMATGLPWAMPEHVGMDANDLHQRFGLRALVGLIRGVGNLRAG